MPPVDIALVTKPNLRKAPAVASSRPAVARDVTHDIALTTYDDLNTVEAEWRAFQEHADCTVFQTFEWLSTWQHHIGTREGNIPCIVIARDAEDRILCILPLAVRSMGFVRELTWLGSALCDYNAPLLAADFADRVDSTVFCKLWCRVMALVQALPRCRFDLVRLEKMPAMVVAQPNPLLALSKILNPSGAYTTLLMANWDDFYAAKRSSSTRRRDRSKRRRLAQYGELKFVTPDNASGVLDTLDVLIAQKSVVLARQGIANSFARPSTAAFFRDFVSGSRTRRLTHVSALRVGAKIAAANLGLVFKGRYYYVLASYTNGEMAHWGPGAAHLLELMRYAIEHQCTMFDFTIGDEPYKRDWCEAVTPLYDHMSVASWRGAIIIPLLIAMTKLKRTIKQTPLLWNLFSKARSLAAMLSASRRPT